MSTLDLQAHLPQSPEYSRHSSILHFYGRISPSKDPFKVPWTSKQTPSIGAHPCPWKPRERAPRNGQTYHWDLPVPLPLARSRPKLRKTVGLGAPIWIFMRVSVYIYIYTDIHVYMYTYTFLPGGCREVWAALGSLPWSLLAISALQRP